MAKLFFIIWCLASLVLDAQRANTTVHLSHYILDSFATGKVKVKSGSITEQKLNYNILSGEMIFDNAGKLLAIAEPKNVDTVFIGDRKFVPVDNKFYEVLTNTPAPLFMEFTYKIEDPPVSVGYGNATPTTNTTSLTSLINNGSVYDLKLPDDFKVIPGYAYWIWKDNKFQKAGSSKQLSSIFPDKKKEINDLIKKNNTGFSDRKAVIQLVQQIEQ